MALAFFNANALWAPSICLTKCLNQSLSICLTKPLLFSCHLFLRCDVMIFYLVSFKTQSESLIWSYNNLNHDCRNTTINSALLTQAICFWCDVESSCFVQFYLLIMLKSTYWHWLMQQIWGLCHIPIYARQL